MNTIVRVVNNNQEIKDFNINLQELPCDQHTYFHGINNFLDDSKIHEIHDEHFVIKYIFKYFKYSSIEKNLLLNSEIKFLKIRSDYYCINKLSNLLQDEINRIEERVVQQIPLIVDINNLGEKGFRLWDSYYKNYSLDLRLTDSIVDNNYNLILEFNGKSFCCNQCTFEVDNLSIMLNDTNIKEYNNLVMWEGNRRFLLIKQESKLINTKNLNLIFTYTKPSIF